MTDDAEQTILPGSPARLALVLEVRFREHAVPTPMSTFVLHRLVYSMENVIDACSPPQAKISPEHRKRPPILSELSGSESAVYVVSLSYNSPLEIVLLVVAASGAAITLAKRLVNLAQQFDKWRGAHASTETEIARQRVLRNLLSKLEASMDESNNLTFVKVVDDQSMIAPRPKAELPRRAYDAAAPAETTCDLEAIIPTPVVIDAMRAVESLDVHLVELDFVAVMAAIEHSDKPTESGEQASDANADY